MRACALSKETELPFIQNSVVPELQGDPITGKTLLNKTHGGVGERGVGSLC